MTTDSAANADPTSDDEADIDHFANHLGWCTTCTGDAVCDYGRGLRDAYEWMTTATTEMRRDAHHLVSIPNSEELAYVDDEDKAPQPVYLGSLRGGTTIDFNSDYGSSLLMAVLV